MSGDLQLAYVYATSLALGLLIGIERERHPGARAGLRTFALTALLGTMSAMLTEKLGSAWLLPAGLVVLGMMMVMAPGLPKDESQDPGTTTVAALLVCYLLGALLWYEDVYLAVVLALTVTALLYFKPELHGLSHRLSRQDLASFLQFAAISFVVLPLLPDRGYGPYEALNPYEIWMMVVLISGLSLAGYVAQRLAGERHGTALVGLLGGAVSSTATTLLYARQHRARVASAAEAAVVILLANLVVLLRIAVIAAAVAPAVLSSLLPGITGALLVGGIVPMREWMRLEHDHRAAHPAVSNPMELRVAAGFALLFALTLVISTALNEYAGAHGVYVGALVSGLVDLDAIGLSLLRLFRLDQLAAGAVASAIGLAYLSNLLFKFGVVAALGGRPLILRVLPGYIAVALGLLLGWVLG